MGNKRTSHPMQPIEWASDGVIRFKRNAIIDWLFNTGRLDLNEIGALAGNGAHGFTKGDQMQLAQLLGYSVSGFGDLSYASSGAVAKADAIANRLIRNEKRKIK